MAETIEKKTFAVNLQLVYAAVGIVGYIVYSGTTKLNDFEARVKTLEAQKETIPHVEEVSRKNENDIKELQATTNSIKTSIDTLSLDVKALNSQMQTLVASIKK
jgi:peptidoglycan hydrolase CwlO-like protein